MKSETRARPCATAVGARTGAKEERGRAERGSTSEVTATGNRDARGTEEAGTSAAAAAPVDDVLRVDPPQLAQQPCRRAETGHHGLQQVEPREGGQQ